MFVGPELHRYHHSAKSNEAVNYGATLVALDLLARTFLYRPGVAPADLGLKEENGYPAQHNPWRAFMLPFSIKPVEKDLSSIETGSFS